jgi:hypothetical protein
MVRKNLPYALVSILFVTMLVLSACGATPTTAPEPTEGAAPEATEAPPRLLSCR